MTQILRVCTKQSHTKQSNAKQSEKNIAKYKKTVPYKTVPKIVQKIVQKTVPLIEVIIVLEADK